MARPLGTLVPAVAMAAMLAACDRSPAPTSTAGGAHSVQAHAALQKAHDSSDPPAFADAARGLVAAPKGRIFVIDPLTTEQTARHAMAFARQHLGNKPVSAIVYTHSHVDHFGGTLGVVSAEDAAARRLPIERSWRRWPRR